MHKFVVLTSLLGLCLSGCRADSFAFAPNLQKWDPYTFKVDQQLISIEVPADGKEGSHTIYNVDSVNSEQQLIFILNIGYDLKVSSSAYYNLTHFSLGLTTNGCCDIDSLLKSKKDDEPVIKEINNREWVYINFIGNNGDLGAAYYSVFSNKYVLFLNLRIDREAAKNKNFAVERVNILDAITNRFTIKRE